MACAARGSSSASAGSFLEDAQIDAPGLLTGQRDQAAYRLLLTAALSRVPAGRVTVESWGDGPERVQACEELGLTTDEYCPGWELDLTS